MLRTPRAPAILRRRSPRLMLALQGGGSHGAFGWGVLERLLEEPWFDVRALSGSSAGALNAAVMTAGWLNGGRQGAQEGLSDFWHAISRISEGGISMPLLGMLGVRRESQGDANARLLASMPRWGSPYQLNPSGPNPLRMLLDETVDLEAVNHPSAPRLLISSTNVHSGQARVFSNPGIEMETLLASACLPSFYQAVGIDGAYYWDGGYGMNPPITPLLRQREGSDLIFVQLTPDWHAELPQTREAIEARTRELTFNAGELREFEALAALPRWAQRLLPNLHRIDTSGFLDDSASHAPLNTDAHYLQSLRQWGRERANGWLRQKGQQLGRRSTLDLAEYDTESV